MCTGATEKQLNSQCITDEMHCDALINADCADCLEHFPLQVQLVLLVKPSSPSIPHTSLTHILEPLMNTLGAAILYFVEIFQSLLWT